MKKFLSIFSLILVSVTVFSIFTLVPFDLKHKPVYSTEEVHNFSNSVSKFTQKYDDYMDVMAEDAKNTNLQTNRLIVLSDEPIDSTLAIDEIHGIGYQILQYDSMADLELEKPEFIDNGYDVYDDTVLKAYNLNGTSLTSTSSNMWSYNHLNVEYAKNACADCTNEVVVGVMDSGVDYNHDFLRDRIVSSDLNFSSSGGENDALDDNGHGTMVAGVIVNSTPDNVKIKPYKVLNSSGSCTVLNMISAVEYILSNEDKPDIINMSFGGYNFEHLTIESELCDRLTDAGVTVVIASGNDNLPIEYVTPADCESAITVGAYGSDNKLCTFSNYGKGIDIAAPGDVIYSCSVNNKYRTASGTSFAAPFVSAGCAYIQMLHPGSTPDEVRKMLVSNSIYMGSDEDIYFGGGMLSLVNLVTDDKDSISPNLAEGEYAEIQELTFDNIPDNTSLVFTTDLSMPSADNGTVFTAPIEIKNDVQINYALLDNNGYVSKIKSANYAVKYFAGDSDFEIDENGVITSYLGDRNNIVVPERINGITPVEVGKDAFSEKPVRRVILPDTVTKIYFGFRLCEELRHIEAMGAQVLNEAFENCYDLRDEVMPNVTKAISSFKNCYKLREIDFQDSLRIIAGYDFAYTSLTHLNLPNVTRYYGSREIFAGTTLISFRAPELQQIGESDFASCHFLQELYVPKVTKLGTSCLSSTYMLTEFDGSNIELLSSGALELTYFDTFNAPKVTSLIGTESYFFMSHIRVLRLPGLTGELKTGVIDESRIEQIYLDNITSITDPFKYSYNLKLLSMQKCTNYMDAKTIMLPNAERAAPLEILWLPSCTDLSYKCINLKMLFAPSLANLNITEARIADFILGDKLKTISIQAVEDNSCRIYAPHDSMAAAFALENSLSLVERESALELSSLDGAEACFTVSNLTFNFNRIYFADHVEFGYLYAYSKDANLDLSSNKVQLEFEKSTDSKQISVKYKDLPNVTDHADVTVRAYMTVDGVTFYSPNTTGKVDFSFKPCSIHHSRVAFDHVQQGIFSYKCMECGTVITKTQEELFAMWSRDYLNSRTDGSADTQIYYLDVVTDGVINAKDYAMINNNKKSNECIA